MFQEDAWLNEAHQFNYDSLRCRIKRNFEPGGTERGFASIWHLGIRTI